MNKIIVAIVAAVGAAPVLISSAAWAQAPSAPESNSYGPRMMWWGGGCDGMFFGPLFMLLVLAAVIGVTLLLVRRPGGSWHGTLPPPPGRSALDILKERFARGEIDKDEYTQRRDALRSRH